MVEKKEHPQAKWLRAIADGEDIQAEHPASAGWFRVPASNVLSLLADPPFGLQLRIKPRTIKIGSYEVVEPMREAPDNGKQYWFISPKRCDSVDYYDWLGDRTDYCFLTAGMCWLKREDAELAAKAITELLTGTA